MNGFVSLMKGAGADPEAQAMFASTTAAIERREENQREKAEQERKKNAGVAAKLRWFGRSDKFKVDKKSSKKQQRRQKQQQQQQELNGDAGQNATTCHLWTIDPNSNKWSRSSKVVPQQQQQQQEQQPATLPFEQSNACSWSMSEAEHAAVLDRARKRGMLAANETDFVDFAFVERLLAFVRQFGAKFAVIADRWPSRAPADLKVEAAQHEDDEQQQEHEQKQPNVSSNVTSSLLYQRFCMFTTLLVELRHEQLQRAAMDGAVARAKEQQQLLRQQPNTQPMDAKTMKLTKLVQKQQQQQHQSRDLEQQLADVDLDAAARVALALAREHPMKRGGTNLVYDCNLLSERDKFLDSRASEISTEDCTGNALLTRVVQCEDALHNVSGRVDYDRTAPRDVSGAALTASMAAAATVTQTERLRYFNFPPGHIRSAIDEFVFLDMPVNKSSKLMAFPYLHDVENYVEIRLQCFVPTPNEQISRRIDALRAIVAATSAVDRETLRTRNATVLLNKVNDDAGNLRAEVEGELEEKQLAATTMVTDRRRQRREE